MANVKKSPTKAKTLKNFFLIALILSIVGFIVYLLVANTSKKYDYIVETNAFFAPFEYYEDRQIVGVDIDIIKNVEKKLGKSIAVKDVEFDVIIDNVEAGKIADAGAAGFTITEARSKKVDFSIPYYSSIQYVLYRKDASINIRGGSYTTWSDISGKILGSQTGSTGYLFAQSEIEEGILLDTNTTIKGFDNHQLAVDAVASGIVDYVIIDELPAKTIANKNPEINITPLYYSGQNGESDYPVKEEYAIAVNKNKPEFLSAVNEVLTEMLKKDDTGVSDIDRLILKHSGL